MAEKRAALNVVKKRLNEIGLGAFSLDLHDKSARPAAVRQQIRAALDLHVSSDTVALKVNREASESSIGVLSRYANRLHDENAAGLSLYSARDHLLASEQDIVAFDVPSSLVAQGAPETFAELREAFRVLPEFTDAARPSPEHPWGFIDRADVNAKETHRSAQELDEALDHVVAHGLSFDLLGTVGTADDVETWASTVIAPRWPLPKVLAMQSPDHQAKLVSAERNLEKIHSLVPAWTTVLDPHILAEDIASILGASRAADESRFFGRKKRRRVVLERIRAYVRPDSAPVILKEVTALLESVDATRIAVSTLAGQITDLELPLLPPEWNPLFDAQYDQTKSALEWVRQLINAFHSGSNDGRGGLVASMQQFYSSTSPDEALNKALISLAQAWNRFTTLGRPAPEVLTRWTSRSGFIRTWVMTRASRNVASATPITLNRWLDLIRAVEPLRTHGLTELRERILSGGVNADNAVLSFEKGLARSSLKEREGASALDGFDLTAHMRTINRFTAGAQAVRNELPRSIPMQVLQLRGFNAHTSSGQIGGLKRELGRKRGGMSVRALLDHFGELITDILPCTLMSPESVARFFPARAGLFDIVVFDEASQIRVADSVGAMGRGNSVVVVGDSKQMPPTSFAESGGNVDDVAELSRDTVQDEESILSECVQARVPRKWLSWHYRSQDESLIAFSNHQYYLSKLSSFPAPIRAGARESYDGYGISLVRVDGHFERAARGRLLRTNRVEAEAIVHDVEHRFATRRDGVSSLGIITFNAQQRDLIENLLRDAGDERIARALDEPDGLFVKNLENVQGDERDTILFSVAFSANSSGVIPLNFGPLSRTGGERRLNVAITRARRQVVLYASFDPRDLRSEDTSSEGIKDLKLYLEMAERGPSGAVEDGHRQVTVDRHRDEIAAELRLAGFAVKTDVGLSDFRIDISIADPDDPEQPLVAVLLDGENWRARRTVADRDGLPIEVLEQLLQWPGVERVWLPGWLHHRDEVLERLSDAVRTAKVKWASRELPSTRPVSPYGAGYQQLPAEADRRIESDGSPVLDGTIGTFADAVGVAPIAAQSHQSPPAQLHRSVSQFEPWVTRPLGTINVLDQLPSRKAAALVEAAIRSAVSVEGPIHLNRLARLVAGAFGLNRVSGSRAQAILRCVPADLTPQSEFLWPAGLEPASWHMVRRSEPGESRNLEHVPLEEIANAMAIAAEEAAGISRADVKREALALFGGKRITATIGARLDEALTTGLTTGRLKVSAANLVLAVRS